MIGFNHKVGKNKVAHVVFADSHVEQLILPSSPSANKLQSLTANLCNGILQIVWPDRAAKDPDKGQRAVDPYPP